MRHVTNIRVRLSIAAAASFVSLFWSGDNPLNWQSTLVSSAEARVGRPLTPVSYAGVARRTTRRAVAVGAAATAVVVAPAATCVQVVNSYGQISRVCR